MISIKKPNFAELNYVAKLWADEKTMEDVGGIHILKPEDYEKFYQNKVEPTDGLSQYFLIFNDNEPIGEVSFNRYHKESKTAGLNIKIEYTKRRMSHATQALKLLCDFYFNEFGGNVLEDSVTSPSGVRFLNKINFPNKEVNSIDDISESTKMLMEKYNISLDDYKTNCVYFILTKEDYKSGILKI